MTVRLHPGHGYLRPLAAVLVAGLVVAGCGDDGADPAAAELRGIVREPLPDVSEPTLPDATTGDEFRFVADDDEVLLVYFGYTHCPDVCPTTLADVRTALEELGDDAGRVDLAMATIDPDRDTPDLLPRYVGSFVDGAHALTTTGLPPREGGARLADAAEAFGVSYSVTPTDDGDPEVVHSGFLYAVDDEGRLQVSWPFGVAWEDIAHDLDVLLARTIA